MSKFLAYEDFLNEDRVTKGEDFNAGNIMLYSEDYQQMSADRFFGTDGIYYYFLVYVKKAHGLTSKSKYREVLEAFRSTGDPSLLVITMYSPYSSRISRPDDAPPNTKFERLIFPLAAKTNAKNDAIRVAKEFFPEEIEEVRKTYNKIWVRKDFEPGWNANNSSEHAAFKLALRKGKNSEAFDLLKKSLQLSEDELESNTVSARYYLEEIDRKEKPFTYEDLQEMDGYKELIKMGWMDVSSKKQRGNLNVFFHFPDFLVFEDAPGGEKKVLTIPESGSGRVLKKGLGVYSTGYVRAINIGNRAAVINNKYRKESESGNPTLVMDSISKWNDMFAFCKEYAETKIQKWAKREGVELIFYPGPDKRGAIAGKRIGII